MKTLAFHCATTGMIQYSLRSDNPLQPHIVELAAVLYDTEKQEVIQTVEALVKPDGWYIETGAEHVHGISEARALAEGISEQMALDLFLDLYGKCDLRVAHSISFDNRIIRCALKRYKPDLIPDEIWKDKNLSFCTMHGVKDSMKGISRRPLSVVYEFFTGQMLQVEHTTMRDALAALEIWKRFSNI